MARLSLTFLLLLSLLSLSLARYQPQYETLLPNPDVVQSQPSFLPQLPNPESESQSQIAALPEFPNPEKEEEREITELPSVVPEERPESAETETVQYIVVPVHQFRDVRNFDNLQDIGFSLRLPMRHGHRHHHHRFGGFGHRFGHRFRHGMTRGFEGQGYQMENAEERRVDMQVEPVHMKEKMEMDTPAWSYDFTQIAMEDDEKMEKVKEFMKKMRKCKHHHMEKGMMHKPHEHHHGPREESREEHKEEGEEGGFIKQLWNIFNF